VLARVALWALIAVGAVRGVGPAASGPGVAGGPPAGHEQAAAVAAAFLREYLTVGDGQAGRRARLAPFLSADLDVADAVQAGPGDAQYVDAVLPAGARPAGGTLEVTVLAHVLELRSGRYRSGGTLAFVVPMAEEAGGAGVTGAPRPSLLPATRLAPPGRVRPPAELSRAAGAAAERAVAAVLAGDRAGLARLGGGGVPEVRALPAPWRASGVVAAEVTGPADGLMAEVQVRARPSPGGASYLVPVRVWLADSSSGPAVRRVDAGGPAW
jgi:hypothetical protein